jgi:hypothetical protein
MKRCLIYFLICCVLCCHIAVRVRADSIIGHWLLSSAPKEIIRIALDYYYYYYYYVDS